jgi:hypothetical protein
VTSARQRKRAQTVESILRKHNYGGVGSTLLYLRASELSAAETYLVNTPRVTEIGLELTQADASHIIGGTLRARGNIALAMQLDCLDNQYHKVARSLRNAGVEPVLRGYDFKQAADEDVTRFKALLYAEDFVFAHLSYHPDAYTDAVTELYRYVEENPTLAYRIMAVAKQRYSLDVELIKDVLGTEAQALGMGVL